MSRKNAPAKEQSRDAELSLDLFERLFGKAHRWIRGRRGRGASRALTEHAATLASLETILELLARMLAESAVLVRPSEANGGVRGRVILLPTTISVADSTAGNRELYLLRTSIAATQSRLSKPANSSTTSALRSQLLAMRSAMAAVAVLRSEFSEFGPRYDAAMQLALDRRPPIRGLQARARSLEDLRRRLMHGESFDLELEDQRLQSLPERGPQSPAPLLWGGSLSEGDSQAAIAAMQDDELAAKPADGTEIEAPPKDEIERHMLERDPDCEVAPLHLFEKVETLDDYQGGARRADGGDELEDHLEALDEVDLRQIVRGGEDTHSIYRADLEGLAQIPDVHHVTPGERGITYDEWDASRGCYRRDWVTVYPTRDLPDGDPDWSTERLRLLEPLRKQLERRIMVHRDARSRVTRQSDGDEIDLSAVVDSYAARRARHPSSQRLYIRTPKNRRDTATTVLLDLSLSADSWVQGHHVLTLTRDAALLLGEVADELGDRLQLLAFASNTRNHCRVWTIKDWDDSWHLGRARLGALHAQGYTRMGPAIRHATAGLRKARERRRLLLLLTDGKPSDFDRYEGHHGVQDVSRATKEAADSGVTVHALGIDPRAAGSLPAMFGVGGWHLLKRIVDLPEALVEAYGRATSRC